MIWRQGSTDCLAKVTFDRCQVQTRSSQYPPPPSPAAPTAPPTPRQPPSKGRSGGLGGQGELGTPCDLQGGFAGRNPTLSPCQGLSVPTPNMLRPKWGGALGWGAREGRPQRGAALAGGSPWGLNPCAVTLHPQPWGQAGMTRGGRRVGQWGPLAHTKRLLLSDPLGWGDWSLLMSSGLSQHPHPRGALAGVGHRSPRDGGDAAAWNRWKREAAGEGGLQSLWHRLAELQRSLRGCCLLFVPVPSPPNAPTWFAVTLGSTLPAAQHPPGDTQRPKIGGGAAPLPSAPFAASFSLLLFLSALKQNAFSLLC